MGFRNWLAKKLDPAKSRVAETPDEDPRNRPCNEAGHHYDEPHRTSYYPCTTTLSSRGDVKVRAKDYVRCTKCDNLKVEKRVLGYVEITEDEELKIV